MKYNHTQVGYLMIYVLIAISVLFAFIFNQVWVEYYTLTTMILVVLILIGFVTLNVTIDDEVLKIKFGYGIYSTSFLLNEIDSVKQVKNPWYIWWWIRIWFWPKKTIIYNISGFDAVEIVLKNGKIYRIGTDESQKLYEAIEIAIK